MTEDQPVNSVPKTKKRRKLAQGMVERQWKPGQSGNPAGRAVGSKNKKTELLDMLEALMFTKLQGQKNPFDPKDPHDMSLFQAMNAKLAAKVIKTGDTRAYNALTDRFFGKLNVLASDPDSPVENKVVVQFIDSPNADEPGPDGQS